MIPKTMQKGFFTIVEQACEIVPGFRNSYQKFHQKAIPDQNRLLIIWEDILIK